MHVSVAAPRLAVQQVSVAQQHYDDENNAAQLGDEFYFWSLCDDDDERDCDRRNAELREGG